MTAGVGLGLGAAFGLLLLFAITSIHSSRGFPTWPNKPCGCRSWSWPDWTSEFSSEIEEGYWVYPNTKKIGAHKTTKREEFEFGTKIHTYVTVDFLCIECGEIVTPVETHMGTEILAKNGDENDE